MKFSPVTTVLLNWLPFDTYSYGRLIFRGWKIYIALSYICLIYIYVYSTIALQIICEYVLNMCMGKQL